MADPQCIFAPPVDLGRRRGPEYVIKHYITEIYLQRMGSTPSEKAYEAALNVGDSTGGPRKACGNSLVLQAAR